MNIGIVSYANGEKSVYYAEGVVTRQGNLVKIEYAEKNRDSKASILLSLNDSGYIRLKQTGSVNVSLSCNSEEGELSLGMASGGISGNVRISGFSSSVDEGSGRYSFEYTEHFDDPIVIRVEMKVL